MYLKGRLPKLWRVPVLGKPFECSTESFVLVLKPRRLWVSMFGRWPILWRRLCLWAAMTVATFPYIFLRGVADNTGMPREQAALALDRLIGFGEPPPERLQDWFYAGGVRPFDWVMCLVHMAWFFMPEIITIYVVVSRWDLFPKLVGIRLGVLYAGLIGFFVLPTEPPWMASHVARILEVKAGAPLDMDLNLVAAFPSLHVALPAALAMWLWTERLPLWALLFTFYTALTTFAVVYLGEHYVVDVLAGIALAYLVVRLVAKFLPSRRFGLETGQPGHSCGVTTSPPDDSPPE